MQDPARTLQEINNQLVAKGQSFPQVTLADGAKVQTGSMAGLISSIKRYNEGERGEVEDAIRLTLPTLVKLCLSNVYLVSIRPAAFESSTVRLWLTGQSWTLRFVPAQRLVAWRQSR